MGCADWCGNQVWEASNTGSHCSGQATPFLLRITLNPSVRTHALDELPDEAPTSQFREPHAPVDIPKPGDGGGGEGGGSEGGVVGGGASSGGGLVGGASVSETARNTGSHRGGQAAPWAPAGRAVELRSLIACGTTTTIALAG